jgi:hypothetical protein
MYRIYFVMLLGVINLSKHHHCQIGPNLAVAGKLMEDANVKQQEALMNARYE